MYRILLVLCLALGLCDSASAQSHPRCNIGADPVNRDRKVADDEELVINPADQLVKMKSGSQKVVECILQAGAPVVIDKATGTAKWVFGCGNDLLTSWKPKYAPLRGQRGEKGDSGAPGAPGQPGQDGRNWEPSFPATSNAVAQATTATTVASSKKDGNGVLTGVLVGAGIVLVAVAVDRLVVANDNDGGKKPGGATKPATDGVCSNPMATNYNRVGACTFGPGGGTNPATLRAQLGSFVGYANRRIQLGLQIGGQ